MSDTSNSTGAGPAKDFDLDEFMASLDAKTADKAPAADAPAAAAPKPGLDSTLSYAAAGEDYPELPEAFGDEGAEQPMLEPAPSWSPPSRQAAQAKPAKAAKPSGQRGAVGASGRRAGRMKAAGRPGRQGGADVSLAGAAAGAGAVRDAMLPLDEHASYPIRGGGSSKAKSPLITAILALVVIAGAAVLVYGITNVVNTMATVGEKQLITLTPEQTRSALDAHMPQLIGIVNEDHDPIQGNLANEGNVIFSNSRYVSDSPDKTATGREIVRLPVQVSEDFMTGYYEGGYNAYSVDDLQQYFNGAWTLDLTRGDSGNLQKLKYVNLNAASLADEMDHLAQIQGLTGEGVTVKEEGTDPRGNTVRQGTRVIGDTIYFWKIAACPFSEVYTVEKLNTAVYISVTVATFDFYTGGDEIK